MFLSNGTEIREAIEQLLAEGGTDPVKFAVAYWGRGAASLLPRSYQVVCNLESGACYPPEIRRIWEQSPRAIRQLKDLHAKIVLSDTGAIVSSANCSSNGLGLEREEGARWEEAGFLVREKSELQKMQVWFSRIWENAKPIYEKDIANAEALWKSRPKRVTIDAAALVEPHVKRGHIMCSAVPPIRKLIMAAMPDVKETEAGKIAIWATHLVMARSGAPLLWYNTDREIEGEATEQWLLTRKIHGTETQKRIKSALQVLSQSLEVQEEVRYWANHLLEDLPWKHH